MRCNSAKAARFGVVAFLLGALSVGCGSGSSGPSKPLTMPGGGNGGSSSAGMQGTGGGNGGTSAGEGASAGGSAGAGVGASTSAGGGTGAGAGAGGGAPGTMGGGNMLPGTGTSDGGLALLLDGGLDSAVAVLPDGSPLDEMLAARPDQGQGDGTDVIMIGDSWMLLGATGISLSLENPANGGNPAYTNYAVAGTQLLNGQIPSQYTQAKAVKSSIRTVVMTAGGNDVLLTGLSADCAAGGTTCQMTLNNIGAALGNLWNQMGMDGVTDVVHIMYSAAAGGGLKDPAANMAGLQKICDAVPQPMHCHLLNTDMLVGSDLMADGIHPSAAACDRVAQAVTAMMQMYGMRR
jgi:hypothetical protein